MANFGRLLAQFSSRKHSNLARGLDMSNNSITGYQSANSVLLAVDLASKTYSMPNPMIDLFQGSTKVLLKIARLKNALAQTS